MQQQKLQRQQRRFWPPISPRFPPRSPKGRARSCSQKNTYMVPQSPSCRWRSPPSVSLQSRVLGASSSPNSPVAPGSSIPEPRLPLVGVAQPFRKTFEPDSRDRAGVWGGVCVEKDQEAIRYKRLTRGATLRENYQLFTGWREKCDMDTFASGVYVHFVSAPSTASSSRVRH